MSDPGSPTPAGGIEGPRGEANGTAPALSLDGLPGPVPQTGPSSDGARRDEGHEDPRRSPTTSWRAWTAPVALLAALVLTTVASLFVDVPAVVLGAKVTSSHTPPGLTIADTFVQDVCFVLVAIWFATLGARKVASWQFGLRRPPAGWWAAGLLVGGLLVTFIVLSVVWSEAVNPSREKLLEQLGTNEGTGLLVLSAALTCIVAPICEEFLFRGYIFTALRNWRGTWPAAVLTGLIFGGVHVGSAPALDLFPLAGLGFGLCLLYRYTGSLYPCFAAHALDNSLAFASLESWSWQLPVLVAGSLTGIACVVLFFKRLGLISDGVGERSLTTALP